ncbi:hypothetical protein A3H16_03350 [Candidatus Kaiserbacteria bacterium RIFCSPLOWO2_12_FULL_53_8]|uniref:Uncharacterized protein n=2 Tax=Candidatus Kaiseribacteriota TaxID=1752734 RepID=A0A1F6CW91_9BACT|nr:MAG: hypothetical protein A2851_05625 [Candidatus Kaiserbacteria bacterium RIFCSPHIGHO2_01_FULL_53_29]OGG91828.1 MAG: hypothetical protein A3H16_03350 [Candidatus Kaiserbacteria bacterium RIFCSPLOWO2_12_FULL_53_8]
MKRGQRGSVALIALSIAAIFALLAVGAFAYLYLQNSGSGASTLAPQEWSEEKAGVLKSLQTSKNPQPIAPPPEGKKLEVVGSLQTQTTAEAAEEPTPQDDAQKNDILKSLGN